MWPLTEQPTKESRPGWAALSPLPPVAVACALLFLLSASRAFCQAGKAPPAQKPAGAPSVSITPSEHAPNPASKAIMRPAWSEPLPGAAVRLALADVAGLGRDQVVTLAPRGQKQWTLAIHVWKEKQFERLWSADLEMEHPLLAAGRFVRGEARGQVVVSTGVVAHDTRGYRFQPFDEPLLPLGQLRRLDGWDSLLLRIGGDFREAGLTVEEDGVYRVSVDENMSSVAAASDYLFGVLHGSAHTLGAALPPEYAANGVLGFWAVVRDRRPLRFALGSSEKAGEAGWWLAVAETFTAAGASVVLRGALEGPGADVAVGDPKGEGRPALVVLGARGAARILTHFVPAVP